MKKFILSSGGIFLADLAIFFILGLTPLFFNYFYPTSIDLSKMVIFKVFLLLFLFAVVWNLAKLKISFNKSVWKNLIPAGLLFIFLVISLFFSIDITTSWFGSYEREEGLVSWLFYGLWFILLILHLSSITTKNNLIKINYFLQVISISGLLVSIYALCQIIGLDFMLWSEPASVTGRAVSFFGQPNYLACWLILVLPFSAYLIFITKDNLTRFAWLTVFFIELLALLATGSRAAFFVFLLVSIFWLIWFLTQKKILSRKKLLLIIGSSFMLFSIFIAFLAFSNNSRFLEFTDLKKGSAAVRLELWKSGWQAFTKKPLLGYGLENQKEAYISYYKVDSALYSKPNTYSDRAHNLVLDILLTSGIIGLLFFVYFIYWVFCNLFKGLKNSQYQNLSAFLIWALAAYLASLLFNFSVTVTNIYFWFIVALSFIVIDKKLFVIKIEKNIFDLAQIILVAGVALIFFYGSFIEIRKMEADYYFNKALMEINNSEYFMTLVFNDYIYETHPNPIFITYYNQEISLRFLGRLPGITDKSSLSAIKSYLVNTEKILTPTNFESKFVKAFILGEIGNRYESEKIFSELILISPELPKVYLAWGDLLIFNRDYKNAIIKFDKTLALLPDLNNPYLDINQKKNLIFYRQQVESRLANAKLLNK